MSTMAVGDRTFAEDSRNWPHINYSGASFDRFNEFSADYYQNLYNILPVLVNLIILEMQFSMLISGKGLWR